MSRINRGILHYKSGRHADAIADLRQACQRRQRIPKTLGRIHYNLALVHLGRGDRASARASADQAIAAGDEEAWDLRDRLPQRARPAALVAPAVAPSRSGPEGARCGRKARVRSSGPLPRPGRYDAVGTAAALPTSICQDFLGENCGEGETGAR